MTAESLYAMILLLLMDILIITAASAMLLYVLSAARLGMDLSRGSAVTLDDSGISLGIGAIAVVLHAIYLYQGVVAESGLSLGFFNALSLLGWMIAALLIAGTFLGPVLSLGIVMFPGAAITLLLMVLFPSNEVAELQGGWPMKVHVLSSILAYSLFALAAVQVILIAVLDRSLRRHRAGGYVRALPPLQTMEALLFQIILLGFVILNFSLLTGAIYITDMFAQHLAHKTVLSIVAWLVFAILLWGHWQSGWRGRKAMVWTLSGFVVLGLAYPVTKFILEIILNR